MGLQWMEDMETHVATWSTIEPASGLKKHGQHIYKC